MSLVLVQIHQISLSDAKDVFNLTNLVKKPTCFKSQDGNLIDLMLTNRPRSFLKSQNFEIGLNDWHKLVVRILKASSFTEIVMSLTKNLLKFLTIYLIITPH